MTQIYNIGINQGSCDQITLSRGLKKAGITLEHTLITGGNDSSGRREGFPSMDQRDYLTSEQQKYLVTNGDARVNLWRTQLSEREDLSPFDLIASTSARISGQEPTEKLRGSGVLIARISNFYGRYGYDNTPPEESGFALDIPLYNRTRTEVDLQYLARLITDDPFLRAIRRSDEDEVRAALTNINSGLDRPIIATPYLSEVLTIRRQK